MARRCLLFFVVAALVFSTGSAWAFSAFVDLSATDGYTPATPTGVATGGVTVLQGPMPTQPTLFYNTFLYPGASYGTMANITPATAYRLGSSNMNASGQIIMCQTSPPNNAESGIPGYPYLPSGGWSYSNGTATALPQYPPYTGNDSVETYAAAINSNGDVAGHWNGSIMNPYIYSGGTYYTLNDTTYYGSSITALNSNGQAVGWTDSEGVLPPDIPNAKVWTYTLSGGTITSQTALNLQTSGGMTSAYPSVFGSVAVAINNSGTVVIAANNDGVNYPTEDSGTGDTTLLYNMNTHAYTMLAGLQIYDGQTPFGTGTQYGGHGQAINDSGQVVGRMLTSSGAYDAAIWQNGTLTDLNTLYAGILPAGFTLTNATAIDGQGDIAGYGTDAADNTNQAFVIYAPIPGDANLDGKVDINDLTIVLAHYNQSGTWTEGEFTGSGKVDINDLTIVLAHYNDTTAPAAGGPSAVPEPCALALLAAGVAGLLACAWRKRR